MQAGPRIAPWSTDISGPAQEPEQQARGRACLERTRTAVLNVLIGDGLFIALSGGLLRFRTEVLAVPAASRLAPRARGNAGHHRRNELRHASDLEPADRPGPSGTSRESRFYWSHICACDHCRVGCSLGTCLRLVGRSKCSFGRAFLDCCTRPWVAGFTARDRARIF